MELLGLIDALEAAILSSPKLLLTDKTIIDESKILDMIDKIRLVVKNGGHIIHERVDIREKVSTRAAVQPGEIKIHASEQLVNAEAKPSLAQVDDIIDRAKEEARGIIDSADGYAQDMLEKLHLTVLKLQRNLMRVEKTIEDSKKQLKSDPVRDSIDAM